MTDTFHADLVAALAELDELPRDRTAKVGAYSYNYADLGSVLGYVRPILAKHDIAVSQPVSGDGEYVHIETHLIHKSGEKLVSPALAMPRGRTAQETGSAITYGRRYGLLATLGMATEDDDGAAASKPRKAQPARKPEPTEGMVTENQAKAKLLKLVGDKAAAQKLWLSTVVPEFWAEWAEDGSASAPNFNAYLVALGAKLTAPFEDK